MCFLAQISRKSWSLWGRCLDVPNQHVWGLSNLCRSRVSPERRKFKKPMCQAHGLVATASSIDNFP